MASDNYDFTPWDSSDDIEKFIPAIVAGAKALGGAAMAAGKAVGAGAKAIGAGAKTALSATGKGLNQGRIAVQNTAGKAITGKGAATAGATKTATSGAADAAESAASAIESQKPEITSTPDTASEPSMETAQPTEPTESPKDKKLQQGMQMIQQNMAASKQQKQNQTNRASEMARNGASVQTGEPMNIAWRLLKEDIRDYSNDDDGINADDEFLRYKFDTDFMPLFEDMNERQKEVAQAALDLPSDYLKEEGWDGGVYQHLFTEGHEQLFDHEYEQAKHAIKAFGEMIRQKPSHMRSREENGFLEDEHEHPEHPWSKARRIGETAAKLYSKIDGFSEKDQMKYASEPMGIAMRLLKMPIVPNSLKQREGGYTGQFYDPIDDENTPLYLHGDFDEETITGSIPKRARTDATPLHSDTWMADNTEADPHYQRRGYTTALYDALAAVLNERDAKLYPNPIQSEEGEALWGDKESWPVRDDIFETGEPMGIAKQFLKEDEDEVPDPRKFRMSQEDLVDAYREVARERREAKNTMNMDDMTVHPGEKPKSNKLAYSKREYFPTTLKHPDQSPGIARQVMHNDNDRGTFEGLPFKDDFTRGEPLDYALDILGY